MERFAGKEIGPLAFGQPDRLARDPVRPHAGLGDRRHEKIIAEEILLRIAVGRFHFRVLDIKRSQERHGTLRCLPDTGVEIRHHLSAKPEGPAHGGLRPIGIGPGPAIQAGIAGRVGAKRGGKRPELARPGVRFLIASAHVTADIVRPEKGADIPARAGEGNLEGQHLPTRIGVTGKLDRVAVIAPSGPAGKGLTPPTILGAAGVVVEIEDLEIGDLRQAEGVGILLPIEPPEIDALLLARQVRVAVELIQIGFVPGIEGNRLAGGGILLHRLHKIGIHLFMRLQARCGMIVESDVESLLVKPFEQRRRIGNQGAIPSVTGPGINPGGLIAGLMRAIDVRKLGLVQVPIHVHHDHIEREAMLLIFLDDLLEFIGRVGPVAGVPTSQAVLAREWNGASDGGKAVEGRAVIVPVTEEIPIKAIVLGPRFDPIAHEQGRLGVIQEIPPIAGKKAFAQRHGAGDAIQRANGPAQILRRGEARLPGNEVRALLDFRVEILRGKRLSVVPIGQLNRTGIDLHVAALRCDLGTRIAGLALDREPGREVDEFTIRRVFEPDQVRSNDREAGIAQNNLPRRLRTKSNGKDEEYGENEKKKGHGSYE